MRLSTKLTALGVAAFALAGAGLYTNGMPWIGPAKIGTNLAVAPLGLYTQLAPGQNVTTPASTATTPVPSTNCCGPFVAVDTNLIGGASPQTVAATPFQLAGTLLDGLANTQTSTVHAATSNTLGGVVITEALTTAAGATYTFTLTNSLLTAAYAANGFVPQVAIYSISNTGGVTNTSNSAALTLTSTTLATGSVVWVWTNNGNTALNGTMYIAWHV